MTLLDLLAPSTKGLGFEPKHLVPAIILFAGVIWAVYCIVKSYVDHRRDTLYGLKHGCQPPPEVVNRWPLGIDRIKQLLEADAQGRFLEFVSGFMDRYPGGTCSQRFGLGPRGFNTIVPQNVEAILSSSFNDYSFGIRADVMRPLMGDGIFTQEGVPWKHSRSMLRNQFKRAQFHTLSQFDEHIDNLLARLPRSGPVDLQPLFFDFTLDTSSALLLGQSVYSLRDNSSATQAFAQAFQIAQEGLVKRMRVVPLHFLVNGQKFRKACKDVHAFIDNYICQVRQRSRIADKLEIHGIIDQMVIDGADDKTIRDQILNVLVAGRDTTACCLSWTFRLLARHPDVLEKLRAEIQKVISNSIRPKRSEVKQMHYLTKVVKETLRLYPPVPVNVREAKTTTILPAGGGIDGQSPVLVRKGEVAAFCQYGTSRSKKIFGPDASRFCPERWDNTTRVMSEAFYSFNLGPRRCLGEEFALLEIYYVVIAVLQTYPGISVAPEELGKQLGSEKQSIGFVLSCAEGCTVELTPALVDK